MITFEYIQNRNVWKGTCPRCGIASFYNPLWNHVVNDVSINVLECHSGHMFVVESDRTRGAVHDIYPIASEIDIPEWLPIEYKSTYGEMMYAYNSKKYRSAIALARIILDAHINSNIKNPGEKRSSLKERLELLKKDGLIDHDQFAEATITRLAGNETVHPKDLSEIIKQNDAKDVIDAITRYFGRFYQHRTSKSLPTPKAD